MELGKAPGLQYSSDRYSLVVSCCPSASFVAGVTGVSSFDSSTRFQIGKNIYVQLQQTSQNPDALSPEAQKCQSAFLQLQHASTVFR